MRTETYERDGISYVISLYELNHRFHSGWSCTACEKSSNLPDLFFSAAEAIARAKTAVFTEHHVRVHQLPERMAKRG